MSKIKENNLEKILNKRLQDYECFEGRNLFPAIAEGVKKQKRTVRLRFYLAAAVSGLIFLIIAFVSVNLPSSKNNTVTEDKSVEKNIKLSPANSLNELASKPIVKEQKETVTDKVTKETIKKPEERLIIFTASTHNKVHLLPDNSEVYLKKGSSVTYSSDFGSKKRSVSFSGTGYFDIKKNDEVPFIINGVNSITRVVGTSFNLTSIPGREEIYVTSGIVKFSGKNLEESQVELKKGMYALASNQGVEIFHKENENVLAWKTGVISFKGALIKDVFSDLENYWDKKIEVKNSEILNCSFSGKFIKPEIKDCMEILALSLKIEWEEKENVILISGEGCK